MLGGIEERGSAHNQITWKQIIRPNQMKIRLFQVYFFESEEICLKVILNLSINVMIKFVLCLLMGILLLIH